MKDIEGLETLLKCILNINANLKIKTMNYTDFFNLLALPENTHLLALFISCVTSVFVLLGMLFYRIIDEKKAKETFYQGNIINKEYNSNRYYLVVKSGELYKIEVDMQEFYSKMPGEVVQFKIVTGWLSKKQLPQPVSNLLG